MNEIGQLRQKLAIVFGIVAVLHLCFWLYAFGPEFLVPGISDRLASKDFANYWIAAKLAVEGRTENLFGPWETYFATMQAEFGEDYPWRAWSYPPHFVLLIAPLGLMPYKAALLTFLATTFALFIWSARTFSGKLPFWAWLLVGPTIFANVSSLQNGFLTAGFALAALGLRDRQPVLSGIFLGLLTVKPHLGLLFPVLFAIEGRWRAIGAATATALVTMGSAAVLFGIDSWRAYIEYVLPYQKGVMMEWAGIFLMMMPSLFASMRLAGFDGETALAVHVAAAVPILVMSVWAMVREPNPLQRSTLMLVSTFVLSPYAFSYDLCAVAYALAVVLTRSINADHEKFSLPVMILAAVLMAPIAMIPLGGLEMPFAPLVFAAALFLLLRTAVMSSPLVSSPAALSG